MNKILIRIFAGLASVITVLGLFVTLVVNMTNDVRKEHFFSDLVSSPLNYLSVSQIDTDFVRTESKSGLYENDAVSGIQLERIEYGQVVLVELDHGYRAYKKLSDDLVAVMDFDGLGTEIYRLHGAIVAASLNNGSVDDAFKQNVRNLEDNLDLTIAHLDGADVLSQVVLDGLAAEGFYRVVDANGVVQRSYVRIGGGEVVSFSLDRGYSPFSWWVFFFLLLTCVGLIMLVAYYFVEGFSRRLRSVEGAASRLSRGELEARVAGASDEDAISRLGLAFNSMAEHIQRLMAVQKEMIHAVSHELRTPVARIRFGVQMIEDCPSQEAMSKQVKGIDGDIQELDELIDEILTYARLEQGGPILAFQEADVSALVEQVISEQASVKPDMEIFSEFKPGSDVWKMSEVEARYIHRSIQNLVGNATRYASGKVKVVCAFDAETCRIDVEDDGPGIPEAEWESVFTPFARLDDSRTRSSGGYGLGLSIVRRILYWHGGQAFLGRSDMGGAKFSLVWPRRQAKS